MFNKFISEEISSALLKEGIKEPTEIQKTAFGFIAEKKDVIAVSPTGTGKTLAYLLPIFTMVDKTLEKPQAVIVAPTHELAVQIKKQSDMLFPSTGIKSALVIGGASIKRQLEALKEKPKIIIGACGRILELVQMKKLTMHFVKTIVLDEADRLLNEKNIIEVKKLINTTLRDRQLLFFSASLDNASVALAQELSKEAELVNVSKASPLPDGISHIYFECEQRDKTLVLRKVVHALNIKKAIVFVGNGNEVENIAKRLSYHGLKAVPLYGAAFKEKRRLALADFKEGRATVLVASDIAARGLDIKGVTHVFNLDMPNEPTVYLHRVGRTARMNETGTAVSIVTAKEVYRVERMEKAFKIKVLKKELGFGKVL